MHRPLRSRLLALSAVLPALTACGSSSGGGLATSTAAGYGAALLQLDEQWVATCAGGGQGQQPSIAISGAIEGAQLQAIVTAGKATYDAANGAACIAAAQALGCWLDALPPPPACAQVFTGASPVGGACVVSEECVPGAHCTANASPASGCTAGVCVAYALAGQGCAGAECAPGTTCGSGSVCVARTEVAAGGACGATGTYCAQGTYCGPASTCVAPTPRGGACGSGIACAFGLGCAPDGTCQPYVAAGGACGGASQGPCGAPFLSAMSCASGVCTTSYAAPGAACSATLPCLEEYTCDATSSTCVARLAGGAACAADAQCQSSLCTGGLCASPICPP